MSKEGYISLWTSYSKEYISDNESSDTDILKAVAEERKSQDTKWGIQNHSPAEWIVIAGEEFGEVCKAALENNPYEYLKELIQVSAVCVAAAECVCRNFQQENEK